MRTSRSSHRSWLSRATFASAVAGLSFLLAAPAVAQTAAEKAGARAAATSGVEAFDAGDYDKAIDLFLRAESIIHSPVHELFLARSYAKRDRLVEARETYLKIIRENQDERGEAAREELDALEPRVPRVTLNVAGTSSREIELTLNGKPFPAALVGVAQPFDPGDHAVVVVGGGRRLSQTFTVREGETLVVELDVSRGELTQAAGPPVVDKGDEPRDREGGTSGLRVASYVSFGVGLVGLGVGTAFSVVASSKANEANDLCSAIDQREGSSSCAGRTSAEEGRINDLDGEHDSAKTLAIVGFAAGGALVATGVTLFLLSGDQSKETPTTAARIQPIVGLGYLGLRGVF